MSHPSISWICQTPSSCRYLFTYLLLPSVLWHKCVEDGLWQRVFLKYYKLPSTTVLAPRASCWRSKLKRLHYHTPVVLSEAREEHKDEVLHVSFSNDGTMFATCSKDGYFKVGRERPSRDRYLDSKTGSTRSSTMDIDSCVDGHGNSGTTERSILATVEPQEGPS